VTGQGARDCVSGVCTSSVCQVPTCADTVKNSAETDVDCGGGTCPTCAAGKNCLANGDCASSICTGGKCQAPPSCTDATQNGTETDVDCGGGTCPTCANGKNCGVAADCTSALCTAGKCQDRCANGAKDGAETDVDCGGGVCPRCGSGKICGVATDCLSGTCTAGICVGGSEPEYGKSASKIGCVKGNNTTQHVLDWGSGNGRIVLLGLMFRSGTTPANTPGAITYDGVAMHQLATPATGGEATPYVFYLLDSELPAAAGTYTVNVTGPDQTYNCVYDVSSFRYVKQSAPASKTRTGTTFTDGIAAPNANSWAYDFVGHSQGTVTPGAGQTLTNALSDGSIRGSASYKDCGTANPCNMSWTIASVNYAGWIMALLEPAGASGNSCTKAYSATGDTYVYLWNPTSNFGTATTLPVQTRGSYTERALIRFNLASLPSDATITSAVLALTGGCPGGSAARPLGVHRVNSDRPWVEGQATWNNYLTGSAWTAAGGDYVTTATATASFPVSASVTTAFELKTDVQAFVSGTATNQGWVVRDTRDPTTDAGGESCVWNSKENATGQPALTVQFTTAQACP
jgi:hypothetical protein